jgi:hypothetical protein
VIVPRGTGDLLFEPHDHVVNFYDDEAAFAADVTQFLAGGLINDEVVVVVATHAHRQIIDVTLARDAVDVAGARESGRYVCLDAAQTLSGFMVDASPDRDRFMTVVGGVIATASDSGRRVRAFGEMVALLWRDGNVSGALELEELWNELARRHRFSLYCAYPMSFIANDDLAVAGRVCDQHSGVVAPSSYASGEPTYVPMVGMVERSQCFVPVPLAARAVRRFTRETFSAWGMDELVSDAMIVVSELASNVLLHASSPFRVSARRVDAAVRIEVHDLSPALPERRDVAAGATNGRGVALVAALSRQWGTDLTPDGKVVWAEMAT